MKSSFEIRQLKPEDLSTCEKVLCLLKESFPDSRYCNLAIGDFSHYIEGLLANGGFFLVVGEPICATCHSRRSLFAKGDQKLDIVQIGGMCVVSSMRKLSVATTLNNKIRECHRSVGIDNFSLFAGTNSPGYSHALSCGFVEVARWRRRSIRISSRSLLMCGPKSIDRMSEREFIVGHIWGSASLAATLKTNIFGNKVRYCVSSQGERWMLGNQGESLVCLGVVRGIAKDEVTVTPPIGVPNHVDGPSLACVVDVPATCDWPGIDMGAYSLLATPPIARELAGRIACVPRLDTI